MGLQHGGRGTGGRRVVGRPESTTIAKMASRAIFQYNVLAIDDTHNTWTNICVKMIIIWFIGPRDEKIQNAEEIMSKHRLNRREANYTHRCNGSEKTQLAECTG